MRSREEVLDAIRPRDPKFLSEVQKQALLRIQLAFEELATSIIDDVPESADRTVACRKLLECKRDCVQAITHTGFQPKEKTDASKQTESKGPQAKTA